MQGCVIECDSWMHVIKTNDSVKKKKNSKIMTKLVHWVYE